MDVPEPKHDHDSLIFPEGFLWGAGSSAFQTEGDNFNTDWWEWEQTNQPPEKRSGKAVDQYHLYEQDYDMAKSLGHNSHRLGIEWARIEPKEGEFDESAIEHYKQVLKSLKDRGFTVMLTLHHFSNPNWFVKKGGWTSLKAPYYFERFVKKIVPEIKEYVDLWITINEPNLYAALAYKTGEFPPQKDSVPKMLLVYWQMAQAHKKAYKAIHKIIPQAKVGITHHTTSFDVYHRHSILENMAMWGADIYANHLFYLLTGKSSHDFIGINYYKNYYISFNGNRKFPSLVDITTTKKEISDLGWEVYPEGIFDVIMDYSDYHLPIYITENGIASTNDDRRVRFILNYLKEIYHAIAAGVDVKGYFYWSLTDNMELAKGFEPRFGLAEVDYKTMKRTPRPSAYVYKEIIENNGIPHRLLKLLGHGLDVEKELIEIGKKDH